MTDLTNPKLIKLKGLLFLVIGIVSAVLLVIENPSIRHSLLLFIAIWSFCRAYYFAFYVIERYVDPSFKFAGLWAFARYMMRKKPNDTGPL